MAALANIYSKMIEKGSQGLSTLTTRTSGFTSSLTSTLTSNLTTNALVPLKSGAAPLRGFANEDVFFYQKRIDNSGVVRAIDPKARGNAWKLIGSVSAAAVLGIGILLPGAYSLVAGYDIQKLKAEERTLEAQKSALDLRAAKILTPARWEALADEQGLIDPAPENVIYLGPKPDDSAFAANHEPVMPGAGGQQDAPSGKR
jgi:hypothetical protein